MDDQVEIPVQRVLFRQSSKETRLSPVHLSDEESDYSDEDTPKVVDVLLKKDVGSNEQYENISQVKKDEPVAIQTGRNSAQTGRNSNSDKSGKNIQKANDEAIHSNLKEYPKTQNTSNRNDQNVEYVDMSTLKSKSNQDISNQEDEEVAAIYSKVSKPTNLIYENVVNPVEKPKKNLNIAQGGDKLLSSKMVEMKINNKEKPTSVNVKRTEMATLRPKSPKPTPTKNDKEESIWDKLGTLGRKKRIKEVQEVEAEGKYAIDSPGHPAAPIIPPEEYELDENEERSMLSPSACGNSKFFELQQVLIDWVNDELSKQRIIVQDLAEDLYDGQVLQKLLEILTGGKLDVPEVTQSEEAQKQKLRVVLNHFNQVLGFQRGGTNKWSVQAIHSKNIVPIMHLLVALARHFRPPVRLTENVSVQMVVVKKVNGQLIPRNIEETITSAYDDVGMRCERDAFDTLFDHAPDKLQVVKKSMVTFVNKHLNKINLEVSEVETQFHDGVYLTLLMGLLEGFFVPLHSFHLTPKEHEQKVHNVTFAFELMEEVGIPKPKARPEDIVNYDLKSTLRVLYNLFTRYKHIS